MKEKKMMKMNPQGFCVLNLNKKKKNKNINKNIKINLNWGISIFFFLLCWREKTVEIEWQSIKLFISVVSSECSELNPPWHSSVFL